MPHKDNLPLTTAVSEPGCLPAKPHQHKNNNGALQINKYLKHPSPLIGCTMGPPSSLSTTMEFFWCVCRPKDVPLPHRESHNRRRIKHCLPVYKVQGGEYMAQEKEELITSFGPGPLLVLGISLKALMESGSLAKDSTSGMFPPLVQISQAWVLQAHCIVVPHSSTTPNTVLFIAQRIVAADRQRHCGVRRPTRSCPVTRTLEATNKPIVTNLSQINSLPFYSN